MTYLTFDIGTTNIKSAIYKGKEIIDIQNTPVNTKDNKTQDSLEILRFVSVRIEMAIKNFDISSVLLSTAMHTIILLDENYQPVSDMMLWCDTRSEHAFDSVSDEFKKYIYQNTGTPLHSMSPLSKLVTNEVKFSYYSDLKSFLMLNLSGDFVTDYSSASASGIWNYNEKKWDNKILRSLNLEITQFPSTVEIDTEFKLEINPKVKVIIGATDGVLANRGIAKLEEIVISAGTSIGLRKLSKTPIIEKGFCYYAGFDTYLIGQASNNGGNVIEWIRKKYPSLGYEEITDIVLESDYLDYCIPYIFGERGPHWIDGLELLIDGEKSIDREIQSLIYGSFTNVKMMLSTIDSKDDFVYLTGGLFNNKRLRDLFSKIIKKNLVMLHDDSAVSMGLMKLISEDFGYTDTIEVRYSVDYKLDAYINDYIEYIYKNINR